jgi:hypothetical protein
MFLARAGFIPDVNLPDEMAEEICKSFIGQ